MKIFNKLILTFLMTISLLGCKSNEQQAYNIDITVKRNDTILFKSSVPVKEETLYSKVEDNCKLTLFLSKKNDEDIQLESELNCNKGDLLFTPQFVIREGDSSTLEIGEETEYYSYTVKVTKS